MRTELEALLLYAAPRELLIAEPLSSATSKMLGAFVSASAGVRAETVQRDMYQDGGAQAAVVAFYGEDGAIRSHPCQGLELAVPSFFVVRDIQLHNAWTLARDCPYNHSWDADEPLHLHRESWIRERESCGRRCAAAWSGVAGAGSCAGLPAALRPGERVAAAGNISRVLSKQSNAPVAQRSQVLPYLLMEAHDLEACSQRPQCAMSRAAGYLPA